jgi:hypothetical protein
MADRKSSTKLSPKQELGQEFQHLLTALAGRAMSGATDRVGGLTDKLSSVADGAGPAGKAVGKVAEKTANGDSPAKAGLAAGFEGVKEKVKGVFGKGDKGDKGGKGGKGGKKLKVTNIIEEIDIGAPIDVVYNQWTQFQDWSNFMKKVEGVEQKEEPKLDFKAQVLWSHRTWEAQIVDQVPNERIVWRSKGQKGHVDGAVSFHELGPSLTKVIVVLEYYPQGLFEQTGNMWRAQGRRTRLELKHFRRHVMMQAVLQPDELEGWRGEIHDGEVTRSHEDAMNESGDSDDQDADDEDDELDAQDADDELDEQDEDAEDAEDAEDEDGDEDAEDEYADDEYDDDAEDYEEDEDERPSSNGRARRRARAGSR